MRAKLINEIKQNKETSGLGSIGIGKIAMVEDIIIKQFKKLIESNINVYSFLIADNNRITINVQYDTWCNTSIDYIRSTKTLEIHKDLIHDTNKNWTKNAFDNLATVIITERNPHLTTYSFDVVKLISENKIEETFDIINQVFEKDIEKMKIYKRKSKFYRNENSTRIT